MIWALLLGCVGGGDDGDSAAIGDDCPESRGLPEGLQTPIGSWSGSFAQDFYDDTCSAGGLDQTSEAWINSFTLAGNAPEALYIYFDPEIDANTEIFDGVMDPGGGVTFTGVHAHAEGTMYAQFGGLYYYDQYRGRWVIDGSATLGLDVDQDGQVDCAAKGSWTGIKSG